MKKVYAGFLAIVLLAFSCLFAVPNVNAVASANSWETMAEMPTARDVLGVGVVNGKIYAIGGESNSGTVGVNEMYDPATNTWITKKSMPKPRSGLATAVLNNKIYCIGGPLGDGVNEVYDPVTDAWETKQPMPTPRGVLSASVVNDKIYLIGGFVPHWTGLPQPERSNVNEMYDPATDSWTTLAPLPTAVAYCVSVVVDDKIYVFGNSGQDNNEVQIYDPQTNTWSYGPSMPYSMAYEAGAATTGVYATKKIYLVGGSGGGLTQIFDPETGTWSTGAGMPTPRRFLSVAVVDDLLYAIGGVYEGSKSTGVNERYVPFGYSIVPPVVSVVSPEQSVTYAGGNIFLAFTVDRSAAALSYSLDGKANVTITGNTSLAGLSSGAHNVTVYATYPIGNTGASQTIHFAVAPEEPEPSEPEPFPTAVVAVASTGSVVAVGACLLLYFRKRRR